MAQPDPLLGSYYLLIALLIRAERRLILRATVSLRKEPLLTADIAFFIYDRKACSASLDLASIALTSFFSKVLTAALTLLLRSCFLTVWRALFAADL